MQRQMMRSMVFSLLVFFTSSVVTGCAIQRPDTDICIVNAPAKNRKCYNLKRDYDDNGQLKPGATPTYRPNLTIEDLNKATVVDSATGFEDGWAALKAYIKNLREAYEKEKALNQQQPSHNGGH